LKTSQIKTKVNKKLEFIFYLDTFIIMTLISMTSLYGNHYSRFI